MHGLFRNPKFSLLERKKRKRLKADYDFYRDHYFPSYEDATQKGTLFPLTLGFYSSKTDYKGIVLLFIFWINWLSQNSHGELTYRSQK
jgi:hypothetical protein